jgi:hypothetical protein
MFSGVLSAKSREISYRIKQLLAMPLTEALLCQFEVHYHMAVAAEQQFRFSSVKRARRCCCGRLRVTSQKTTRPGNAPLVATQ